MNNYIEVSGRVNARLKAIAVKVANDSLVLMNQPSGLEVAVKFVSKRAIKKINKEFRNVDKVTDVLSFPSTELKAGEIFDLNGLEAEMLKTDQGYIHFGDMALCTKKLKMQAKEFGTSVEAELKKLVIHSILHLMGYDHIKDNDYVVMNEKEKYLDNKIKI